MQQTVTLRMRSTGAVLLVLFLALVPALLVPTAPASASTPSSAPVEPRTRTDVERMVEARIFADHVLARRQPSAFGHGREVGLPPLPWNAAATQAARAWSDEMARTRRFEHSTGGWRSERLRAWGSPVQGSGENILWASGWAPDRFATSGTRRWMDSDGHRRNILRGGYGSLGVGVSVSPNGEIYATVVFVVHERGTTPPTPPRLEPSGPRPLGSWCPAAGRTAFVDVVDPELARATRCLAELGVATGRRDGRFAPDSPLTRAQMATFMTRAISAAGGTLPSRPTTFRDVAPGSSHATNIGRLAAAGIVTGRADGTFRPGQPVQRGHAAKFATLAHEHVTGSLLPYAPIDRFRDDDLTRFESHIGIVADQGWDVGDGRRFRSAAPMTRGEMALLLARWLDQTSGPSGPAR